MIEILNIIQIEYITNLKFLIGLGVGSFIILFSWIFTEIIQKLTRKKIDLSLIKLSIEESAADIKKGYTKLNELYETIQKIK